MPFEERPLRTFLVHPPKPARVIVQTEEGPQITPGTGKTWASMAQTIVALRADAVELYDSTGKLLRAMRADEEEKRQTPWTPGALPVMPSDPETVRLLTFANLLFRATEFSTTLAFSKMVDLFERMSDRSDAIEQRLERTEAAYRRTLNEQVREALEQAAEMQQDSATAPDEDPLAKLVRAFGGGLQAGKQARAPSNGKGDDAP